MDLPAVFTPRETVSELDRYVVGQNSAKRAVAIALRNRWRRQQVPDDLKDEIAPKNIIMIGPTGVGKTEIARRLARLGQAPFLKVEASKFTEVGYVGRDVESMIRDLTDLAVNMIKAENVERIEAKASRLAEDRILDLLLQKVSQPSSRKDAGNLFAVGPDGSTTARSTAKDTREALRKELRKGALDDEEITIQTAQTQRTPGFEVLSGANLDEMMSGLRDAFSNLQGLASGAGNTREQKTTVKDALRIFTAEEGDKMVDMDQVVEQALIRVQSSGIIFLDEVDKIAGSSGRGGGGQGPDISRGGVQRDLLPIVEGSSVNTKHGVVKTDHILFIAAGAFHETSVSDLIPELQGRFPIRVELDALGEAEFLRILQEPKNSLVRQYEALLHTENVTLEFTSDGLEEIARVACQANERLENIGARRLHTVMEKVLEDLSYNAPELRGQTIRVDSALVNSRLRDVLDDEDLSRYIL